jgi:hypothetical protein
MSKGSPTLSEGRHDGSWFSAKAIGRARDRTGSRGLAVLDCDSDPGLSGVAMTDIIKAALEDARRWGAIGAFRLASSILRCTMILHRQGGVSPNGLRIVLSGTRWLERCGAWLALGHRRKRRESEQGFQRERID